VRRFKGRLVCYVATADGIRVVRVLSASRDLNTVFGS
jgi:hypothetical protein